MNPFNYITRFQYNFSFQDLLYSLGSIKSKCSNYDEIKDYFSNGSLYFTVQGRVNLRLLLNSLGLDNNAKIGVQTFNCANVFESIKVAGYKSVFIDVNNDYTMDIEDLARKVAGLDALIITHTFGIPAQIDPIRQITGQIPIIEDCAHSLFSCYKGKVTGTFFNASIFSIGYGKYPSIGKGGFCLINNRQIVDRFEEHFILLKDQSVNEEIKNAIKNYLMAFANKPPLYNLFFYPIGKMIDRDVNLTNKFGHSESKNFASNSNLLEHNFAKYKKINEQQREVGKKLIHCLKDIIHCIDDDSDRELNFYIFPLRNGNRDKVVTSLAKKGIECGRHFANSILFAETFGYQLDSCPNSEKIAREIFTIPSNYSLTDRQIDRIINAIKEVI